MFDTHATIKNLKSVGIQENQAEVIVAAILEIRQYDLSKLVTTEQLNNVYTALEHKINDLEHKINDSKTELEHKINDSKTELEHKINDSKTELEHKINTFRAELKQEIADIRAELKHEISELRMELRESIANTKNEILRWMLGLMIPMIITLAGMGVTIFTKIH